MMNSPGHIPLRPDPGAFIANDAQAPYQAHPASAPAHGVTPNDESISLASLIKNFTAGSTHATENCWHHFGHHKHIYQGAHAQPGPGKVWEQCCGRGETSKWPQQAQEQRGSRQPSWALSPWPGSPSQLHLPQALSPQTPVLPVGCTHCGLCPLSSGSHSQLHPGPQSSRLGGTAC